MILRQSRVIRKLSILLLSVALIGTFTVTALASDSDPPLETGSISIVLQDAETGSYMTDGLLSLYRVADVEETGTDVYGYTYTEAFAGMEGQGDLNPETLHAMAGPLSDYVSANGIPADVVLAPNEEGKVEFDDLSTGLYLIVQTQSADGFEDMDPFLVSVPMDMGSGLVYDIDATPKTEVSESEESPGDAEAPDTGTEDETPPLENSEGETSGTPSAQTGDYEPVILVVLLMAVCLVGMAVSWKTRKKREEC